MCDATEVDAAPMEGTILIVDDEVEIAEILKDYLGKAGFCAVAVPDDKSALEYVEEKTPDLLILDLRPYHRDIPENKNELVIGDGYLVVNFHQRIIHRNGEEVHLTPNEYNIFKTMVLSPNRVFTREQLIACAIGDHFEGYDRCIDSHIKGLRQKIEPDRHHPRYFVTVFGVGYKFVP